MFTKIFNLIMFIIFALFLIFSVWDNVPKDVSSQPITEWVGVAAIPTTQFYAIKRVDIGNASVNLPFGFLAKKVIIETPASNTDEIAVDWLGGTAVAPAANTAGDDLVPAGRIITFDSFSVTSISVIAVSGTQTIYVRAFN